MRAKGGRVIRSAEREKKDKDSLRESIEKVERHPRQMTAQELSALADQARKEGYKEGYETAFNKGMQDGLAAGEKKGRQQAYDEAKTEIQELQTRLRTLATRLFDPYLGQEQALENQLLALVTELAKHLIAREVEADPQILRGVVEKALKAIPKGSDNIRVYLNEKDAAVLDTLRPRNVREWNVVVDNNIASGGCRVATRESLVDYSIETRVAEWTELVRMETEADPVSDLSSPPDDSD